MTKDTYKAGIKAARQDLFAAYRVYRLAIKKQRLLREQAELDAELKSMGVVRKQIPITFVETRAKKIPVRKGK